MNGGVCSSDTGRNSSNRSGGPIMMMMVAPLMIGDWKERRGRYFDTSIKRWRVLNHHHKTSSHAFARPSKTEGTVLLEVVQPHLEIAQHCGETRNALARPSKFLSACLEVGLFIMAKAPQSWNVERASLGRWLEEQLIAQPSLIKGKHAHNDAGTGSRRHAARARDSNT